MPSAHPHSIEQRIADWGRNADELTRSAEESRAVAAADVFPDEARLQQAIARRARVLHPERLFVAGMLHDIGTLLINKRFPEIAQSVIIEAAGDEDRLHTLEQRDLGFDHALLAGMMLDSWHLPDTLVDTVYWHHEPQRAQRAGTEAAILKVADAVANCSGTGSYSERIPREQVADVSLLAAHGLAVDCTGEELMDEVDPQFIEAIYLIVA